jgi:ParB-like chromosome segregation protein Spo0J
MQAPTVVSLPIAAVIIPPGRTRRDMGDLDSLAASMKARGLLQPIGIDARNYLLFGERRLLAAERLGWRDIDVRVVDIDAVIAEHDENECRKQFTPTERAAIARAIKDRVGDRRGRPKKAEDNSRPGARITDDDIPGEEIPAPGPEFPDDIPDPGQETDDYAAKKAGLGSRKTLERVEQVEANGTPALVGAMNAGEIPVKVAAEVAALPPAEQEKVVKDVRAGKRPRKAVADRKKKPKAPKDGDDPADAPPDVLLDALGVPVPPASVPAFEGLALFDELRKILRAANAKADELARSPAGARFRERLRTVKKGDRDVWASANIEQVLADLNFDQPYSGRCPSCQGADPDADPSPACRGCRGAGWATRDVWKNAQPEQRDSLTALAAAHARGADA